MTHTSTPATPHATELVAVVIPIYRPTLSEQDRISLTQTTSVLSRHPLVVVHPEGMDTTGIAAQYPMLRFRSFPAHYFADIKGYNRFMLSEDLYMAFAEYEYILIAQLDVFIFTDTLEQWCRRGFDYVGAPWIARPVYSWPLVRQYVALYQWWQHRRGRITQHDRYGRVGNGGLSLRRVSSHLRVIREQPDDVHRFAVTHNRRHLHNEDTFWALIPKGFSYPTQEEAMLFSYNKYPELSHRLTGGKTPFGCHGWTKPSYGKFWLTQGEIPSMPSAT